MKYVQEEVLREAKEILEAKDENGKHHFTETQRTFLPQIDILVSFIANYVTDPADLRELLDVFPEKTYARDCIEAYDLNYKMCPVCRREK